MTLVARLWKWAAILSGGCLLLAGLLTVWLPLPTGLPLMLFGLIVLLRHSPTVRSWVQRGEAGMPMLRRLRERVLPRDEQR